MVLDSIQVYMFFICSFLSSRDISFTYNGRAEIGRFEEKKRQMACKPGSVPGKPQETAIHLGRSLPNVSRDRPGQQAGNSPAPPKWRSCPYLVLLRVGFTVPPLLPTTRCALTAPFHPYLP